MKQNKKIKIEDEADVEKKVLEPLLKDIGFGDKDWQRQVPIKFGRNEKAIPDYLINVTYQTSSRLPKADWVWEAKYSIPSKKQFKIDFDQVVSYANPVGAKGVGLICKEGLWLCRNDNGFAIENAQFWDAKQLGEAKSLAEIQKIAGKTALKK